MEIFRESNKYSCFYDLLKKRTLACLRIKCHLTFYRTSYAHAKEDPFVVKAVFALNIICPAQNFVLAKH
jgi:hypothetical protein